MQTRIVELAFSWRKAWNLACNSGSSEERSLVLDVLKLSAMSGWLHHDIEEKIVLVMMPTELITWNTPVRVQLIHRIC